MNVRLYISYFSVWYEASQQQQWKTILQTECHTVRPGYTRLRKAELGIGLGLGC